MAFRAYFWRSFRVSDVRPGRGPGGSTLAARTVTVKVVFLPLPSRQVAVITALPGLRAKTRPEELTTATFSSLLVHVTRLS